jgi:hypothetical protein
MHFMLPRSVCILLKMNFLAFVYFLRLFYIFIMVSHKFLEPTRHFALNIDSSIHDRLVPSNSSTGIPVL